MVYHSVRTSGVYGSWGTFNDLRECVLRAVRTIEARASEFDVIAVQGVSGMSVGFPLALQLDKPIVVVRKEYETQDGNSHSYDRVLGMHDVDLRGKRCLFVDDFVSLGGTRARVREAVEAKGAKLRCEYMSREDAYTLL